MIDNLPSGDGTRFAKPSPELNCVRANKETEPTTVLSEVSILTLKPQQIAQVISLEAMFLINIASAQILVTLVIIICTCYSFLARATFFWHMLHFSGTCYIFLARATFFWHVLHFSGTCYIFLARATFFWHVLHFSGTCYIFLAHATFFWHVLHFSGTCYIFLARATFFWQVLLRQLMFFIPI